MLPDDADLSPRSCGKSSGGGDQIVQLAVAESRINTRLCHFSQNRNALRGGLIQKDRDMSAVHKAPIFEALLNEALPLLNRGRPHAHSRSGAGRRLQSCPLLLLSRALA